MPGATRAGPASTSRPELPEALLQRMQAVVNAAHARAVQEEDERRGQEGPPDQTARPEAPTSLPRRVPGTAGELKPPNGVPWAKQPTAPGGRLAYEDAEFDTDPFLPRLTASGAVASPPVSKPGAQPDHAAQANGTPQANGTAQANRTAQPGDALRPDHARRRDRALRRRDRRTAKRDRAAQPDHAAEAELAQADRERAERAERERAERAERERAERERAERERAAQADRERAERAEQERAERERAAQADRERAERAEQERAERERAAQADRERAERERAERERAAQADRDAQAERAAQTERERAAQADRERVAQTDREQAERQHADRERAAAAAWTERERAATAERAGQAAQATGAAQADRAAAERAGPAPRPAPPDQAEPEQAAAPGGAAPPDSSAGSDRNAPPADHPPAATARGLADQPWRPLTVRAPGRRRSRTIALAVGVVALLAVGPIALMLSRPGTPKPNAAEVIRDEAAAWVAQQVSPDEIVSCDLATCLALEAHGVSVSNLLRMEPGAHDLLESEVVVSTATIRNMFGSQLDTVYAPTVLASFGAGNTRIDVRVIAPDGAAAYLSALRTDLQQRKTFGAALAGTSRVTLSPAARRQMDAGQVDAQLLVTIEYLAAQHPVNVLAFGDLAAGASPGVPLRSATLAETSTANLRSMLAGLRVQQGPYRAAHIETTRFDGQPVLVIEFAAPSPLELINANP